MPKKVIIEVDGIQMKKCVECQENKQLLDYYAVGKKKDGSRTLMGKCKACYNKKLRREYSPKKGKAGRPIKYA